MLIFLMICYKSKILLLILIIIVVDAKYIGLTIKKSQLTALYTYPIRLQLNHRLKEDKI